MELRRELRRLQLETGLASVLVTHDPEEAAFLSDEVIVLAEGHVLQDGPVRDVFSRPRSPQVARLLGIANLHRGMTVGSDVIDVAGVAIAVPAFAVDTGTAIWWSIRPEHVTVTAASSRADEHSDPSGVAGVLVDVANLGSAVDHFVAIADGVEIQARSTESLGLTPGSPCVLHLRRDAISVWRADPAHEDRVAPAT